MSDDVTVTQADRDAAANGVLRRLAYQCGGIQAWMEPAVASMRRGEQDDHPDIQDFARHRANHAQAEPVACHSCAKLRPDIEHVGARTAAQMGGKFVCRECGREYRTNPPAQDVAALVEENRRLQQALVDHNDRLRSAQSVALRDGAETNWLSFRGAVTYTLAEHHETVVAARTALAKFGDKP